MSHRNLGIALTLICKSCYLPYYFKQRGFPQRELFFLFFFPNQQQQTYFLLAVRLCNQFSSVQLLSCVRHFVTQWTAARQASLSITNSWSLLKLMSIESVMPSNHLILCHPLLPLSIFPSIRVFSNESALCIRWPKYWSFSFNISPSNIHHSNTQD